MWIWLSQTGWIINSLSQEVWEVSVCVWLNLSVCQITSPHHKPNKGCIFLPSQLYVGRHGELHGNVWVATGYFVCSQAHFAAACVVMAHSGVAEPCFAVRQQGGNGFHFPGRAAVCRPCFMPTDAHSSWRGLLMTCTDLEQHWGCYEWVWGKGRTTPRNLTEPLWQGADVRKQLE